MVQKSEGLDWTSLYYEPFSLEGSRFSIMLLSTFVPTAIHLFCAIFAVLPTLPVGHITIANFMPSLHSFGEFEAGDKIMVAGWLTLWSVVSVAVVWWFFDGGMWLLDLMWSADPQERNFWQVLLDTARDIQQWTGISIH